MNVRALSLLCVAVVCLAGSRGFGADDAAKKEEPKKEEKKAQFEAGTYTGTYTASTPGGDEEGELTITLDENGKFTGESQGKNSNVKAILKGTRLKDNKTITVFELANGQKASCFGTISRTANGGWTGTLIQRIGTTAVACIEYEVGPKSK